VVGTNAMVLMRTSVAGIYTQAALPSAHERFVPTSKVIADISNHLMLERNKFIRFNLRLTQRSTKLFDDLI
jgi:hypothetical protein